MHDKAGTARPISKRKGKRKKVSPLRLGFPRLPSPANNTTGGSPGEETSKVGNPVVNAPKPRYTRAAFCHLEDEDGAFLPFRNMESPTPPGQRVKGGLDTGLAKKPDVHPSHESRLPPPALHVESGRPH